VSIAALALLVLVSCARFMARPELLSFVLLALVLRLLDRFERTGDGWIWLIIPVQILWVNVHGLFAAGIAVCAMHFVGEFTRPLGERERRARWERIRSLAAVTAVAALCSLLNPNGVEGALYPVQQLQMVGTAETRGFLGLNIIELQPSIGGLEPLPLSFFLLLAGLSAGSLALNWRRLPPSDLLLWVAFFYLALGAKRNVALFAIVAAPMLVRNCNRLLDARTLPRRLPILGGAALCLLLAALSVDATRGSFYPRIGIGRAPGLGIYTRGFPVGAVEWIERWRPRGPIAHDMRNGGYLIWRLFPEYRVMTDGRLEVFGPEVFRKLVIDDPETFQALDTEYAFGVALMEHGLPISARLFAHWQRHPDWRLAFVDDAAALFVRADSGQSLPWPDVDLEAPELFPPVDGSLGALDEAHLRTRTRFFWAVGRTDLALSSWEQALALFPDLEDGERIRSALREQSRMHPLTPR
jgi:hypothetical protein